MTRRIKRSESLSSGVGFTDAIVWQTSSFAAEWFADALAEARLIGRNARRREILFAVCAAESYLFEWVRDVVLGRAFDELSTYFPPGNRRGVRDKCKKIPKLLADKGGFRQPDWSGHVADFERLVDFATVGARRRNRPDTTTLRRNPVKAHQAIGRVRTRLGNLSGSGTD
jgi:hypothetical protein